MSEEKTAQQVIEHTDRTPGQRGKTPAAGPHASESLTDEAKTPGSGTLPNSDEKSVEPGAG